MFELESFVRHSSVTFSDVNRVRALLFATSFGALGWTEDDGGNIMSSELLSGHTSMLLKNIKGTNAVILTAASQRKEH